LILHGGLFNVVLNNLTELPLFPSASKTVLYPADNFRITEISQIVE